MCGIAGIVDFKNQKIDKIEALNFFDSVDHRGPDASNYFFDENKVLFMGSKRLKILDLQNHANQPMYSFDKDLILIYNGEIYNYLEIKNELVNYGHKFRTISDTEVLLKSYQQWGENFLNKLDGMWSFAMWDVKKKKLFLSRDRYGEKPLYYRIYKNRIYFASELKAFLKLNYPKHIEYNSKYFLNLRDIENSPETILKDVENLNAGTNLVINENKVVLKRWWDTNDYLTDEYLNKPTEYLEEILREKVTNSLKKRLRSHAPLAYSVSGGIDSSILYCLSEKINQSTLKYPIGIFSYFNQQKNNDFFYIQQINKNKKIYLNHIKEEDIKIKDLEKSIFYNESIDNINLINWFHYKHLKEKNIKVSIEGHGPDELLGGYEKQIEFFKTDKQKNDLNIFYNFKNFFNKGLIHKSYLIFKIYKFLRNFFGIFSKNYKKKISFKNKNISTFPDYSFKFKKLDNAFNSKLFQDFHNKSLRNILKNFDRQSMAHGVEVRSPYLNHDIVNFLFSIPVGHKINEFYSKKILRDSFKYLIPEKIYQRKNKQGFHTRFNELNNNKIKNYFKEIIYSPEFQNHILSENLNFNFDKKFEIQFIKTNMRIIRTFILLCQFDKYRLNNSKYL